MNIRIIKHSILLLLFVSALPAAAINLLISGYIFKDSTLQPVPNHVVTLKFKNQDPAYLFVDKAETDTSGYFSYYLELPFDRGTVQVSTVDCNNEILTHNLPFNDLHTQLQTNFSICVNQQLSYCLSDFMYVIDKDQPGKVIFKQAAFGNIVSWLWDFGDGNTSPESDPVHVYDDDGNYEVCLTIADDGGMCNSTYCDIIEIESDTICEAFFTQYPFPGVDNTLQFWDLSFGNIDSWQWDFGDGNTSEEQNPAHTFSQPGIYEVCLTITDYQEFCTDTYCKEVEVLPSAQCNANFAFFHDPNEPLTLNFLDNSTGNPDAWYWDFGDGNTSMEQNPSYSFSSEGIYDVCLTITNENTGCQDNYCEMVMVYNDPPCAAFFESFELTVDPYTYQFVDQSLGNITTWEWDFGDGTTSVHQNPAHSYYENGVYDVCLTISDEEGTCYDIYCETLYVGVTPDCMANYYFVQDSLNSFTFHFTDASAGDIDSWNWDFGDGNLSSQQNPTHTFAQEGVYFVCLTIANDEGTCSDVLCKEVIVTGDLPCQAEYNYFISPENPLQVQFIDLSVGDLDVWIWDFGDGTTSFEANPMHEYSQEGNYDVCLHILDINSGCSDQVCKNIEVLHNPSCSADFMFMPSMSNPLTYQFADQSTGNIVEWEWDFGDGSVSPQQNPVHTFPDEGTYEICLQVTNLVGNCVDVKCHDLTIEVEELCEADFDYAQDQTDPLVFQFTDLSQGIMTQWTWDFGDGAGSSLQNPVHQYADTGTYTVTLTIENPDSLAWCYQMVQKLIDVEAPAPECTADFTAVPDSGVNKPYLFHFSDLSTGNPESWFWDFGDGNTSTEQNPSHQFETADNHTVMLAVEKYNPYGQNCTDTIFNVISTPEYFHFGGFVYAGDYPINNPEHLGDTAEVFLYRYRNDRMIPVDTSRFTDLGYFFALYLLKDHYLIKTRLTKGSANAKNFFPTYYGDELLWESATQLHLIDSSHYHLDIKLHETTETESGTGSISGDVTQQRFWQTPSVTPAADAEILLFDAGYNPMQYVFSNDAGAFGFSQLPFGTYWLIAESAGLFSEPVQIELSESNPAVSGIQLEMFSEDITGINAAESGQEHITLYPNPAVDILFIELQAAKSEKIKLEIINPAGQTLLESIQNLAQGHNRIALDISTLPTGLFIVRTGNGAKHVYRPGKFMK